MAARRRIEFLLLGPLEVRIEGRPIPIGGAKQRAVLAVLLLHANDVVSLGRLVDDVWGDEPPHSAAHTIESYVSRLRRLLAPHGPTLARQGDGYRLDLGDARLDAHTVEQLVGEASRAAELGDHTRAADLARRALALWRGPVLPDAPLRGYGRAEAERLEELRLRALDERVEADLALGRDAHLIAELRPIVEAHPYRSAFVAQLMVALYRSGRHADALELYERTRQRLYDDLGLRPSVELQRLSGEIVRQDRRLARPGVADTPRPAPPSRRRRVNATMAVLASASAAAAVAIVAATGADSGSTSPSPPRVAVLLPRAPTPSRPDTLVTPLVDGLRVAEREYGVRAEVLVADELDPHAPSVARAVDRVREGDFDLVITTTPPLKVALAPVVEALPSTYFVALEGPEDVSPNATAFLFDHKQSGYLAGYLSGLMEARTGPRLNRARVVSVIGGIRGVRGVEQLVDSFSRGARRALPSVTVLKAYSGDFTDQSKCEAIANRHIDAGADIVFAAAGTCSLGALSAAALRGVWGVGVDGDRSDLGTHVLASTVNRGDQALVAAVRSFVQGTLPGGRTIVLGLDDNAVGLVGLSPSIPEDVRRKVARAAASLREATA